MQSELKSVTNAIIAVNLLLFLLMEFSPFLRSNILASFGLYLPSAISDWELWRLITYAFIHIGFINLLLNLVLFRLLARPIEILIGARSLLLLYLLAVLGGGILQSLTHLHEPSMFISSSAGVYGVAIVYSIYFPDRFLIWDRVKIKYLIWFSSFSVVISLFFEYPGWSTLGGIIVGAAYVWVTREKYARHSQQVQGDPQSKVNGVTD